MSELSNDPPPPVRHRGRKTVRTADNARRIAEGLARGLPLRQVCAACKVAVSSVCQWRNSDPAFEQQIQEAIAGGVASRLKIIEQASLTDWRAAAWLLERTMPETFGRQRVEQQHVHVNADKVVIYLPQKGEPTDEQKQLPIRIDN